MQSGTYQQDSQELAGKTSHLLSLCDSLSNASSLSLLNFLCFSHWLCIISLSSNLECEKVFIVPDLAGFMLVREQELLQFFVSFLFLVVFILDVFF